jgi:pimeloyl-ACP methyl ester carboxylesterase
MVTKPEDLKRVLSWVKTTDPIAAGDAMFEMFTHDLRDDLSQINSPTLALNTWIASKDSASRAEMAARVQAQYAKLKGCQLVMSDVRHFIMLDDPDWFYHQVDEFLSKASAPSGPSQRQGAPDSK